MSGYTAYFTTKFYASSCYQIHAAISTADLRENCGFCFTNMAENPAASRKDMFKDKKVLFEADAPLKHQFLCEPIPSTFYGIKSLFFFPLINCFSQHLPATQLSSHRITDWLRWEGISVDQSMSPPSSSASCCRLLRAVSCWVLSICKDGVSTTSLDNLC